MSNVSKEELWRDRIDNCCQSGLSIKEWCNQNQISIHLFHYWKRRLREINTPTKQEVVECAPFSMVPFNEKTSLSASMILQVNHYRLEIYDGFDPKVLTSILQVLQQ